MPHVSRYQPRIDIFQEAKMQDSSRTEQAIIDTYRITGIKPEPKITNDDPFVEDDPSLAGDFEEILQARRRIAYLRAKRQNDPLIEQCYDIDIAEWDELMEGYQKVMDNDPLGLELE